MKMPNGATRIRLGLVVLVVALAGLAIPAALAQSSSEQIVFSGVTTNGIGFWIWCQNSNPAGAPYKGVCAGAMYDYDQGHSRGVFGFVSEPTDGTYVMTVGSADGFFSNCVLTNTPPVVNGPRNTVTIDPCTVNGSGETGVAFNAVVHATGPS